VGDDQPAGDAQLRKCQAEGLQHEPPDEERDDQDEKDVQRRLEGLPAALALLARCERVEGGRAADRVHDREEPEEREAERGRHPQQSRTSLG